MKRLIRLGLGSLLGLGLGAGLASIWIDAEQIARATRTQVSARLGFPVRFEAVDVRWLPRPAVRLREVRLYGAVREPAFLRAERVELRLSLLALLRGRIALRSLEVVSPTLTLAVDSQGSVVLPPRLARGPEPSAAEGLGWRSARFDLRDGVAEIGPHRLEGVWIRGRARPDGHLALAFSAELPGTGSLRDGRLTLTARDGSIAWSAASALEVDLGALPLLRAQGLASRGGVGQGTLALTGTDRSLASAELGMALRDLDLRGAEGLAVRGSAELEARLGGSWSLDLGAAEIRLGASLRKPAGIPARATGPVPEALPRAAGDGELRLHDLQLGRSHFGGDVRLRSGRPSGELSGEVDLGDVAAWSGWRGAVRGGRLHLERLAYAPPLPLHGVGRLDEARIELGERPWSLTLSGPVSIFGSELATTRAVLDFAGERFDAAGSYDAATEQLELEVASRSGVELAKLAEVVAIGPFRTGRAYGRVALRGGLPLASFSGNGEFEVFDGTAHHLSLGRVTPTGIDPGAGPFAFERLQGLFEIRDQRVEFTELVFEQDGESARVRGSVSLADGAVDLAGGAESVVGSEAVVTPIELSGTLDRLKASAEDPPEIQAERREAERTMLEAMRIQMREQPLPDDPEQARAVREHLEHIEERLHRIEDTEAGA